MKIKLQFSKRVGKLARKPSCREWLKSVEKMANSPALCAERERQLAEFITTGFTSIFCPSPRKSRKPTKASKAWQEAADLAYP